MINKIDHLIVSVKNISEAENNYSKLFGMNPVSVSYTHLRAHETS